MLKEFLCPNKVFKSLQKKAIKTKFFVLYRFLIASLDTVHTLMLTAETNRQVSGSGKVLTDLL